MARAAGTGPSRVDHSLSKKALASILESTTATQLIRQESSPAGGLTKWKNGFGAKVVTTRYDLVIGQSGTSTSSSGALLLEGLILSGGWKVVRLIPPSPSGTGGNFSCGYEVESADAKKRGFLKALDYSSAINSPDPAGTLNSMTSAYIFERDLLEQCRSRGLNRVVTAITSGKVIVQGAPMGGLVEYLIFEIADGDVRRRMAELSGIDLSWRFACLHHIATALTQLHGERIAHQDLRPSNVLMFDRDSKLADLGRAASLGTSPPHESFEIAGDPSYAPPELLYGSISPEWNVRRLECDAYLLGSMIVWFFTGLGMTSLLVEALHDDFQPGNWTDTYESVLPRLAIAFGKVILSIILDFPQGYRDDLVQMVVELCEPDRQSVATPKTRQNAFLSTDISAVSIC